jgi:hypothetical protein
MGAGIKGSILVHKKVNQLLVERKEKPRQPGNPL